MKYSKVKEGKVFLTVPEGRIYDASVFYNPEGELNRDISVSALPGLPESPSKEG